MKNPLKICLLLCVLNIGCAERTKTYDICIYGGSSAGVIAAYTARMAGKSVLLVEPGYRLGGLSAGGLGFTDIGNKQVVTGLAHDFYRRIGSHYGKLEQWVFEPKVAEAIFNDYIERGDVEVLYGHRLAGVDKSGLRIGRITVESSEGKSGVRTIAARVFLDCSYEGDLMAAAGVSYTVGREDNSVYDETYNGVQMLDRHQFPDGIDPFQIPGDPESGLLWGITEGEELPDGTGDDCVQAYNYRICLTDDPDNHIAIGRPAGYDSLRYELLLRLIAAQPDKQTLHDYLAFGMMPNRKTDINNTGGFSTDAIGMNHDYPEASYEQRARIIDAHKEYTLGLLYFLGHDPRVPQQMRDEMLRWGLPKDEYTGYGHWTPQLYVRESRRMVGEYVMRQIHCEHKLRVEDGVGQAAYKMDSHNCRRIVIERNGRYMVKNEGNVEVGGKGVPYPVSYLSLTPKRSECDNLLVPICLSASHIAYGSIRMEPVFMVLAQSAAVAACEAIDNDIAVQDVDAAIVRHRIEKDPRMDGSIPDVTIDDMQIELPAGSPWERVRKHGSYGPTCFVADKGVRAPSVRYQPQLERPGTYNIYVYVQKPVEMATEIHYAFFDGNKINTVTLNKNNVNINGQTRGEWVRLGSCWFDGITQPYVEISGQGADGITIADAVTFIAE